MFFRNGQGRAIIYKTETVRAGIGLCAALKGCKISQESGCLFVFCCLLACMLLVFLHPCLLVVGLLVCLPTCLLAI